MYKSIRLPVLFAMFLFIAGCGEEAKVEPLKKGADFPNVALVKIKGGSQKISEFRDKVIVLNMWASWCAPCRKEMPSLERLSNKLDDERFVVLGLSVDEDEKLLEEFLSKYDITFARHIDKDMSIAKGQLGATAFPETYIISRDGKVLRHIIGELEWDSEGMVNMLEAMYEGKEQKGGAYW